MNMTSNNWDIGRTLESNMRKIAIAFDIDGTLRDNQDSRSADDMGFDNVGEIR